nr:MAG TPA: hypothetical protein [Caudoviricetes sp.]
MPTVEERLAALEARMAAWIDQQPTNYYTHQYSGEEIDAAVGRAVTGGALDTSVTNVSKELGTFVRPNLLDNWYFGRPVNQRGQTEYTGNVYYIDRWRSWDGDSASLSVVSGGIKIAGTLYQYFEPAVFEELWGKTVAISLLLADGTLYTDYFALKRADWYTVPIKAHGLDSVQFGINNNDFGNANNNFLRVQPATIGTLSDTILAAKLELGPTQTLAHREGDKWVLNEVPEYGGQLRRCQRYHLGDMQRDAPGRISGKNTAYCIVPIPVTMRQSSAVPIQTFSNYGIIVDKDGTLHVVNNASCVVEADSYLLFLVVSADTMPLGPCIWQDAHFSISKDL